MAWGMVKIAGFLLLVCCVMLMLPCLNTSIFPDVPEPTESYDCDDGTLCMYNHFRSLGVAATPVLGNLDTTGEGIYDCDHVWLMIETGGYKIAYDWGLPCFDRQHYEGYTVDLDYLRYAVAADFDEEASYPAGEIAYGAIDPDKN
jgi:hypothetical protein